ncbi:MAG: DsrE family protein, partial [Gammaproteobacteria bacterium]
VPTLPAAGDGVPAPLAAGQSPGETARAMDSGERGERAPHYYFDVTGHSAEELRALLARAAAIHAAAPPGQRSALDIVLVLHGPDVEYFATRNAGRYGDIVARAGALDAAGVLDFKMCAVAAERRGITAGDIPPFIEMVPWANGEIERLEQAGYVRL